MTAPRACFVALLLFPFLVAPAFAARKPLSIGLDGFAEPSHGDSANVGIVAQIDSIAGVTMGPLVVSCRVKDDDGHTLLDKERVEPAKTGSPRLVLWNFRAAPGKIKVRFQAKGLEFEGDGRADLEMTVPQFGKEPFPVSTPRVGLFSSLEGSDYVFENFTYVPSHRFSGKDVVAIFLSATPPVDTDSLRVSFALRRNARVVKDSSFVARGASRLEFRENPARWGSGQYTFQITLTASQGTVNRSGEFQVTLGGVDLLRDPVLVRTVLGYIAGGAERQDIETASVDSLPSVWARFWKRRDTTPETTANEALGRFLERVEEATNRFGGVVPGWRSDRGRILIQHGDPDRSERTFDPTTRIETEIWYYDQRNVSYVFQDPEGFGNYKLTGGQ